MRIATWNLERGGRSARARHAQESVLRDLGADVLIVTEPGPPYQSGPCIVASPSHRPGQHASEAWVAIVGPSVGPVALNIPYKRMAVAATALVNGVPLLVYGSVLPWGFVARDAPELMEAGETALDAFLRVLHLQTADIEQLRQRYPEHLVIWAGDYNQTLSGPNYGGSKEKRDALSDALDELGLMAWNSAAASADEGMHAIDLICAPREIRLSAQGRIDPVLDAVAMSDHAGYWVEF